MHTRNSNILQYQLFNARTNYFKYSFFPHTVVLWNSLSHATLMASTLDKFKSLVGSIATKLYVILYNIITLLMFLLFSSVFQFRWLSIDVTLFVL
jgi:hypothetical protein